MKNAILGFVFALVAVAAISGTRRLGWWQDQLRTDVEENKRQIAEIHKSELKRSSQLLGVQKAITEILQAQIRATKRDNFETGRIDRLNEAVFGKRNDKDIMGAKGAKK